MMTKLGIDLGKTNERGETVLSEITADDVGAVPDTAEGRAELFSSSEATSTIGEVGGSKFAPLGEYRKATTQAGLIDWINDATSGYLLHLRTGAGAAGTATIGIGTDQGAGNGLLISHKNGAVGLIATGQPGSGHIAEFTSRGPGSGHWINVHAGAGAAQVNARDGGGFSDAVTTAGSTTLTSATAAFAAGDVGKTITQLTSRGLSDPFGCIPAGTTIASVTNSTTVVLSQAAQASGTGVLFNVAGRLPALTQAIFRVMDTNLIDPIATFTRGGADLRASDAASIPLTVTAKASQTARLAKFVNSSGAEIAYVSALGGATFSGGTYLTNASNLGGPTQENTTYSSHPAVRAKGVGSTGNMFEAFGLGASIASRIDKDGYIMTRLNTAPADTALVAGEVAFWLDSTNGAAKLKIKAKQADGTVRTGEVALA